MTRKFWYTMDRGGVASILKSASVKALLGQEAERKAATANSLAAARYPKGASGEDYGTEVADLGFTSVAQVYPKTALGRKDQRDNRTLDSLNH